MSAVSGRGGTSTGGEGGATGAGGNAAARLEPFVTRDGRPLFYREEGSDSPPILLVHAGIVDLQRRHVDAVALEELHIRRFKRIRRQEPRAKQPQNAGTALPGSGGYRPG